MSRTRFHRRRLHIRRWLQPGAFLLEKATVVDLRRQQPGRSAGFDNALQSSRALVWTAGKVKYGVDGRFYCPGLHSRLVH